MKQITLTEQQVIDFIELEAQKAAKEFKGDLVEIGLGWGQTTKKLLRVADEFKRMVIGIDPFEKAWGEVKDVTYTHPYPKAKFEIQHERLILHTERSDHPSSTEICDRPLCFAYVDGLQSEMDVLNDLTVVQNAKVIMVDDYNRVGVGAAVRFFTAIRNRELTIVYKNQIQSWALIK